MKKILFVSDYITNIGGIENYIQNTANLLSSKWNEVKFLWMETELLKKKRFRQLLMPLTWLNIYIALRLIYIYIVWKPDIIRFHSITRFVGWLPIYMSSFLKSDKMLMYHDLWFVSSYPSEIYDIDELPKSWTRAKFLEKSKITPSKSRTKNIYIKSIIWLKFISISVWRFFAIRNIKKHLIPSSFMKWILENRWIKSQNIYIIWHFWERLK